MTQPLYHADPHSFRFTARVLEVAPRAEGGCDVVLDQSAFYPESGGQPADRGQIDGIAVLHVFERGQTVVHRLERAPEGEEVVGVVDQARRLDHCCQHSGQHLLSAAFEQRFDAATVSFHLGEDDVTIDLRAPRRLDWPQVDDAEALANEWIRRAAPVTATLHEAGAVPAALVRKLPPLSGPVRLVAMASFDTCACCGTHVENTGQIGGLLVLGQERAGEVLRVRFVCGERAVRHSRRKRELLRAIARAFDSAEDEAPRLVQAKLAREKTLAKQVEALEGRLCDALVDDLWRQAPEEGGARIIVARTDFTNPKSVNAAVKKLLDRGPALIGVVNEGPERLHLVIAGAPGLGTDLPAIFGELCRALGGKGGGGPTFQQGGAVLGGDIDAALSLLRRKLAPGTQRGRARLSADGPQTSPEEPRMDADERG